MSTGQIFKIKEAKGEIGIDPSQRSTEELINYGIVNIDKVKGPTSHQVSDYVQKIIGLKKAGHSGTLDPAVTGVQPIALGKATRITHFFLTAPKEYVGIMHLHQEVDKEKIFETVEKFTGKIRQLPPVKSAIKREERTREIYEFEIIEIDGQDVLFRIKCQAGTYIRKVCLHKNTQILTEEGSKSISDFYSKPIKIYSYNNGALNKKMPSAVQKIVSPKEMIKLTMDSGIEFQITKDHKMLISKKNGSIMIEGEKIKEGDYIVKSLKYPTSSIEWTISDLLDDDYYIQQEDIKKKCKDALISEYGSIREMNRILRLDRKTFLEKSEHAITIKHLKLAKIYDIIKKDINIFKTQKGKIIEKNKLNKNIFYLLGLIASDGNNTKEKGTVRYTRIKFHNSEESLIDKFIEIHNEEFPNINISKKEIKTGFWEVDSTNSFLATIAANLGITSPQKYANLSPILNSKVNLIKPFLRGYFDGDGSVYFDEKSKKDKSKICYHTINKTDAINIHKMLMKIGLQNKIYLRGHQNFEKTKDIDFYEVSMSNMAVKRRFIKEVGCEHLKKKKRFEIISKLECKYEKDDKTYIEFKYKKFITKKRSKLVKLGGNLSRIINSNTPITRWFYKRASELVELPKLDDFSIEKIKKIETVKTEEKLVYDMTIQKTHNFLIETGYVSSNCHDFGQQIEVGAHMAELRRTAAGPFTEKDNLVTLDNLRDALYYWKEEKNDKYLRYCIQPIENGLRHLKKVWILDSAIESISNGRDLGGPGVSKLENFKKGENIALLTLKGELVAIGESLMSAVEVNTQKKGLAVKVKKVFWKK